MSNVNIELKNIIEAALLVAGQPLPIERMLSLFPVDSQPTKEEVRDALQRLEEEYLERGIELKQVGKGWRIQTRDKYAEYVARLMEERPARYSRALLETMAIIAYRQPVTRGEIEDIRGVAVSTDIIRTLVDRGWIKQIGVREVAGRPAVYGTTPAFLEHFSLKGLEDLPPLAELRSIDEISAELDQRVAGVAANTEQPAQESGALDLGEPESPSTAANAESRDGDDRTVEAQNDAADESTDEITAEAAPEEAPTEENAVTEPETARAVEAQSPERE